MNKISGAILTHNNSRTIREVIESIKGIIDELIIVDDFSEDETITIVKATYPMVQIFQRKLDGFDVQRNFAIEKAKNDWILMIDSDEKADHNLIKAIQQEMCAPTHTVYCCSILHSAFGSYVTEKMERPILFKKESRFTGSLHESIAGVRPDYLRGSLVHNSWVDVATWMER